MPQIKIEMETGLSATDAFGKIKEFLPNDKDLKMMDPSYQCQFDDSAKTGLAKGKKFEAKLKVNDSSTTRVELTVELPLMLTPFKGMVENKLKAKMEKLLA